MQDDARIPETVKIERGDGPCVIENLVVDTEGDLDLRLMLKDEELTRANPLRILKATALRRYWGDLHGQSGETIGMGTAEAYFRHARDAAFVDIVGHQGNDFQITDTFYVSSRCLPLRSNGLINSTSFIYLEANNGQASKPCFYVGRRATQAPR
jgi:hypothetical protein